MIKSGSNKVTLGSTQFVLFLVSLSLALEIANPKYIREIWDECIYQVAFTIYFSNFYTMERKDYSRNQFINIL